MKLTLIFVVVFYCIYFNCTQKTQSLKRLYKKRNPKEAIYISNSYFKMLYYGGILRTHILLILFIDLFLLFKPGLGEKVFTGMSTNHQHSNISVSNGMHNGGFDSGVRSLSPNLDIYIHTLR